MAVYKVMVEVSSHDALKQGRTAVHWAVNGREPYAYAVRVEAGSDREAVLVATQMASCHAYVTAAWLSDFPT